MHLKCVATDYRKLGLSKHPSKCQAKFITVPKKYNILPQNGLISRLRSDRRVYSVYVIAKEKS